MLKTTLLVLLILTSVLMVNGQSGPNFTYYVFNSFYYNPGAAGITNKTNIQTNLRAQYLGYTATSDPGGAIQSYIVSADMPMPKFKSGLGIFYTNSNFTKVQANQALQISYAYHKKINNNILGIGVSAGLLNKRINGNNYRPRDENDELIPITTLNAKVPTVDLGIFLYNPNYQIGISVKNITQKGYTINENVNAAKDLRQYYVTARTNIGISYTIDLSPMLIIKSDLKTISPEIGLMGTYSQKYWVGLNYRYQDAGSVLIGGDLLNNRLKLGYAVDLVSFGTAAKSPTSHELFLRYTLPPPRIGKKSIIKTPRYSF